MKLLAFTVYDTKVEAYLPPLFMRSKGEALRSLAAAVKDPGHQFSKNPEDYIFFHIGEFDDEKGVLVPLDIPAVLASAIDFVDVE